MSKTPEEMAREYADNWHKDCDYPEPLLSTARKATRMIFLAGYEAAKDTYKDAISAYEDVAKQMLEEAVRIMSPKDQLADADKVMPEWISVKEQLPEYDQLVLVWHPGFKQPYVASRVDSALMSPLYWWRLEADFYEPEEVITHWMPLPEAPKEEA